MLRYAPPRLLVLIGNTSTHEGLYLTRPVWHYS